MKTIPLVQESVVGVQITLSYQEQVVISNLVHSIDTMTKHIELSKNIDKDLLKKISILLAKFSMNGQSIQSVEDELLGYTGTSKDVPLC